MITLPASVRVYLCTVACDMRRGFDGLKMLAEQVPRSGSPRRASGACSAVGAPIA